MSKPLTLFVHVPKAAGSTVREILSRNYARDRRVSFDQDGSADFAPIGRSRALGLIVGHYRFGIHAGIARPVRYITMVREPIERYLSQYFYAFAQPSHRLRSRILSGDLKLDTFFRGQADPFATIRQLTGLDRRDDVQQPQLAESIARQSYTAVGVSERFEESILIMAHLCGWAVPFAIPRNRTALTDEPAAQRRAFRDAVPADVVERFARDRAFYDACCVWLDEAIRDAGSGFAGALDAYRAIEADIFRIVESDHVAETFVQPDFNVDKEPPAFLQRFVGSPEYRAVEDFIFSETPLRARKPPLLHGHIDVVHDGILRGWALRYGSAAPLGIVIQPRNHDPIHIIAERDRPDLAAFECGSQHGFEIDLGRDVQSLADVEVYFEEPHLPLTMPERLDGGRN